MHIRADLHIHSTYSDGRGNPREIIQASIERGLNAIAITDHNTFAGSIKAIKINKNPDFIVIPGTEVRSEHGDILLYCEKEIDFPRKIDLLLEKGHRENCLVVPAHPFDVLRLGIGDLIYQYSDWDAIEIWNASANKGANYKAIEAARLLNKPGLANSDAHILEEIGIAYTILEVDDLTVESVLEAIKKSRVKPVFKSTSFKIRVGRAMWSVERFLKEFIK